MSHEPRTGGGMSAATAQKLEYAIIGIGVLALLMIFQPFSIALFTVGSVLVVLAGLINNLLPLAQPGVPKRAVVKAAMIIAMIFCITLLVAIFAADLYGVFVLKPPDPNTVMGKAQLAAKPWYMHSFTWSVAVVTCVLAVLIALQGRRRSRIPFKQPSSKEHPR
jgi:cytochrome c biogenesis factor